MKDNSDVFGCIGIVTGFGLLVIGGTITSGWTLSILWGWFVSPIFGLPTLSVIQAIGISLTVGFIKSKAPQHSDDRKVSDKLIESVSHMFIMPLLSVGIGWIILQFM